MKASSQRQYVLNVRMPAQYDSDSAYRFLTCEKETTDRLGIEREEGICYITCVAAKCE